VEGFELSAAKLINRSIHLAAECIIEYGKGAIDEAGSQNRDRKQRRCRHDRKIDTLPNQALHRGESDPEPGKASGTVRYDNAVDAAQRNAGQSQGLLDRGDQRRRVTTRTHEHFRRDGPGCPTATLPVSVAVSIAR